jgi:hypothetical protein
VQYQLRRGHYWHDTAQVNVATEALINNHACSLAAVRHLTKDGDFGLHPVEPSPMSATAGQWKRAVRLAPGCRHYGHPWIIDVGLDSIEMLLAGGTKSADIPLADFHVRKAQGWHSLRLFLRTQDLAGHADSGDVNQQ